MKPASGGENAGGAARPQRRPHRRPAADARHGRTEGKPAADGAAALPELDAETLAWVRKVFDLARGAGDPLLLDGLLEQGLPPNLCNERGDSLLMLAAYNGNHAGALALLKNGADPALHNDLQQTPLAAAAFKGNVKMVALLLAHGAQVDGCAEDGRTALMHAAMFDRLEVLEQLLAAGANPHAADVNGMTALELALGMGAAHTAEHLTRWLDPRGFEGDDDSGKGRLKGSANPGENH